MPAEFKHRSLPLGDLEIPAPGVVDLWFLDFARLGNPLQGEHQAHAPVLNARQSRALRRFYMRLLLGSYLGMPGKDIEISRRVKGKPILAGQAGEFGVDFSNANSPGCCLIGICGGGHIGVDLEIHGRAVGDPVRLARRYFSPVEAEAIEALGPERTDEAFLHTWACKEAVVKAAGHGIANQLNRFTVSCDPREEPRILSMQDDDPAAWSLALVRPTESRIGAVALRQPGMVIRCFALEAPVHR
jgi:4'-phosphopantetheinyl transferase